VILLVSKENCLTKVGAQCIRVDGFTFLSKTRPLPLPKVDEDGKVHDALMMLNCVTECVM
jgi:hypothetical protein